VAKVLLTNLAKTYPNGCRAVCDLNLEVADGELLVLVGPSGCGKSTTLRLIAGLDNPTAGEIKIGGSLMNGVAPSDRDVAMVFQNYALYPHLSAYENMAFGLKMRGTLTEEIHHRVEAAAALLSIGQLLDRMPQQLSGGERQRVALGRAIVRHPKVFLFDEPLSNLDTQLRTQMQTEIARLHERLGATMIYVTHDQEEAMTLGQRLVVMDRGVVQQVDAPLDVYRRPANRFVATFIGRPPMNLIRGQIENGVFRFTMGHENGHASRPATIQLGAATCGSGLLGIRPEDLVASDAGNRLGEVTLTTVEQFGYETVARFDLAGNTLAARFPADANIKPGDRVPISIRPNAYHFFSEADGRRMN
jgi:multiple sugar transport system ATP-binding protein